MKLAIIHEDEHYIAFNKPSELLSIPDRFDADALNLDKIALNKYPGILPVHRLDKDTSGIIIYAKDEESHKYLSQLFENRGVEKYYLALVNGRLLKAEGTIKEPIAENMARRGSMLVHKRGKQAHTDYTVVQEWAQYSLVRLQLHTGRTHQIRVHMQYIGHPVVGDKLYGNGKGILLSQIKKKYKNTDPLGEEKPILGRLALHAAALRFPHSDGSMISIEAPLPKDMHAAVQQLEKWSKLDS